MKTDDSKAARRNSVAAAHDADAYESTPFGRRRVSKVPKPVTKLFSLVTRRFRRVPAE